LNVEHREMKGFVLVLKGNEKKNDRGDGSGEMRVNSGEKTLTSDIKRGRPVVWIKRKTLGAGTTKGEPWIGLRRRRMSFYVVPGIRGDGENKREGSSSGSYAFSSNQRTTGRGRILRRPPLSEIILCAPKKYS